MRAEQMKREKVLKRIVIIGAGASGLTAAISAARESAANASSGGDDISSSAEGNHVKIEILVIDSNNEPGQKLLATGNGRCNYTNMNCKNDSFMTMRPDFSKKVYELFDSAKTLSFFSEIGVIPREEAEGRVYPYSGQAVSVRASLVREAERLGVKIITDTLVSEIIYNDIYVDNSHKGYRHFTIITDRKDINKIEADSVIIATGGRAGLQYGSTGDGYGFAKKFGHSLVAPHPALVPLTSNEPYFKNIKGVRAKARVDLMSGEKTISSDLGEVQFTSYGLSGICIFNLSRYVVRDASDLYVRIDLVPDKSQDEISVFIYSQIQKLKIKRDVFSDEIFGEHPEAAVLTGIVNLKLIPVISSLAGIPCDASEKVMSELLAGALKKWDVKITGTKGWKEAQTTCGGINTDEVDGETLMSKLAEGLFFCGEVLDVDGMCGGYNLQWSWSSGFVAGKSCGKMTKIKNTNDRREDGVKKC